jgi:hypothetical protein
MDFVPPYMRPDWPVLNEVEGFGSVRDELCHLMAEPSTPLCIVLCVLLGFRYFQFSSEVSVGRVILFYSFDDALAEATVNVYGS